MTLKEMAAELGVSPSIVSRVLNGYTRNFSISDELRQRILEKVETSGYRANPVFRSLSSRNNRHISFMFHGRSVHRAGVPVIEALDRIGEILEANKYDFGYTFCRLERGDKFTLPHLKSAAIVIADSVSGEQFELLEANGIPYVCINGPSGRKGCSVISDERANARLILEHLYDLGHRRIGYMNYPPDPHYSVKERETAFRTFCREFDLPQMEGCETTAEPVIDRLNHFRKQGATAIVTYDDMLAMQLLSAAWSLGVRVPEDLSVITFNNPPTLEYTIPPLSGLEIPGWEMGEIAAQTVMKKTEKHDYMNGREIRLSGELALRGSTARPAN